MSKRVGKLTVGDEVIFEGTPCRVKGFPTRYMVVLENLRPTSGEFSTAKISIRELE